MTVFEASTHFEYLKQKFTSDDLPYGSKARFAQSIGVQPSFISQVLQEKHALSLEQADLANRFFGHSADESRFFMSLVSRDRAATPSLRTYFEREIKSQLSTRRDLVKRLGRKHEISEETRGIFFSSWLYTALQVACTLPDMRTPGDLAKNLGVTEEAVSGILNFLMENGFVEKTDGHYKTTSNWIRLDNASPHIVKHHANWRLRAIDSLEERLETDLHYSGVFSIDAKCAEKVRERLLETLKECLKDIEKSPEKELFTLNLDLFRIDRRGRGPA